MLISPSSERKPKQTLDEFMLHSDQVKWWHHGMVLIFLETWEQKFVWLKAVLLYKVVKMFSSVKTLTFLLWANIYFEVQTMPHKMALYQWQPYIQPIAAMHIEFELTWNIKNSYLAFTPKQVLFWRVNWKQQMTKLKK